MNVQRSSPSVLVQFCENFRIKFYYQNNLLINLCFCWQGSAVFDFAGTGYESYGNCNAPRAVALSALIYCLRSMVKYDIPLNQVHTKTTAGASDFSKFYLI